MTLEGWRRRNGRTALDLAKSGENAQSVVAFWRAEYERTGDPLIMLDYLQLRLSTSPRSPATDEGAIFDDDEIVDERLEAVRARADARRAAEGRS